MENSIAIRNPELAKQWHETKNGKLTPFHVTVGSNKKAWWKCEKGHEFILLLYTISTIYVFETDNYRTQ
ncbi:zinc-ribbon domain-containing protein (plasmid) [Bacillus mycoides]|uniref:zinc-ribbon domain-containing protein n=1 Tax=Bacillus TaxID=1386 RepID=UPI001F3CE329|nr:MULTISPECIES: zinc-ribbon domain-containing protein [Bacillus]MDI6534995.1 zinc-ribbon domain-containing protein [Bacillus mycoides]WJE61802.1 zinc-ribbon domain-containing protein [Bacillus mycoides]WJE67721.1 zinc-ribbon domain-containing protein [Bacillus mycoides]WJE74050.1 zinc-ribbon domain-containing protein [Bacillus mycoides]